MTDTTEADGPTDIPPRGWKDILFAVKDEIASDHVGLISAGVAFYGLLALFPAITALIAISGLLITPSQIVDTLSGLQGLVPQNVMDIITSQAEAVAGSADGGLGLTALIGLGLAIWSASKGVASLIEGLNVAYDEEETRGFVKLILIRLALTVCAILGIIVAILAVTILPAVLAILSLPAQVEWIGSIGTYAVLAIAVSLGMAVLYRFGPARRAPSWRWLTPGAVAGTLLWMAASAGFAFYVANFASYTESFGTLAGAVVLLMWFWISAYVILAGAELNNETEKEAGEQPDTPDRADTF